MFDLELFLSILSVQLGLQNLELNEKQVNQLMKEMTGKQDDLLQKIYEQNEEIIRLLKEKKQCVK